MKVSCERLSRVEILTKAFTLYGEQKEMEREKTAA